MTTMKNFAAQQLSKTQMNEVKGGRGASCFLYDENNRLVQALDISDMTAGKAEASLNEVYGSIGWSALCA